MTQKNTLTQGAKPLLALLALVPATLFAQFNDLQNYGDARTDGGGPGSFTNNGGGSFSITAGGGDFWGTTDNGSFLTASDGSLTTTNDFTATVRHAGTTTPSTNDWGRDGILVRAQPASGVPFAPDNLTNANANAAHYSTFNRSAPDTTAGWRLTPGADTFDSARNGGFFGPTGGRLDEVSTFLAVGRQGTTLHSSYAADVGGGTPGRWVTLNSRTHTTIGAATEVTVGLGHQAHNAIPGGGGGSNTATFDNWSFTDGSFNAGVTGAPSGPGTWEPSGRVGIDSDTGVVSGGAYVLEGGAATADNTGWSVSVQEYFHPSPGLNADIYLSGNPGNQTAVRNVIANNAPAGSTVIPNVDWRGNNGTDSTNPLPYNRGGQGDFTTAVPGFSPTNQNSYGVHMTGQIFIPSDADRGGANSISFKDGVDDYTYLGIDGTQLIDDNAWADWNGTQNGGSPIVTLDVSDPKYDDGEWVEFEMITWEGGGGDNGKLFWDLNGAGFPASQTAAASNDALVPAANFRHFQPMGSPQVVSGTAPIGSVGADGLFGLTLNPGSYYQATLTNFNTGASFSQTSGFVLVPEPSRALLALAGILAASTLRRRR